MGVCGVGGVPDSVVHNVTGFLAEPESAFISTSSSGSVSASVSVMHNSYRDEVCDVGVGVGMFSVGIKFNFMNSLRLYQLPLSLSLSSSFCLWFCVLP